jgi:hypothetical protein
MVHDKELKALLLKYDAMEYIKENIWDILKLNRECYEGGCTWRANNKY